MEDTILSIPFMKKSVLFPIFKLYGPIVHFCHRLHLLSSFKKKDKVHSVVIFTALNIRQPGQWCLGEAALWLLSLLPQVTFQTTERGGENGSGSLSLSWGRELEAPGGHEGGLFSGRNKGEHKALTVRSLPSKTGQCDVHPAWRDDLRMGKEPPKRTRKNGPQGKPWRILVPNRSERESCPEHLEGICLKRGTKLSEHHSGPTDQSFKVRPKRIKLLSSNGTNWVPHQSWRILI